MTLDRRDVIVIGASFVLILLLGAARISGSSVGQYEVIYNGTDVVDDDLLFGKPRPIRSDEWVRWTPVVVSQSETGYSERNEVIRDGLDVSIIEDTPHGGWTAWFEPQHLPFHLRFPVENAFAFRWWFGAWLTALGAYVFARINEERQPLVAALFAGFVVFSPMLHWWWQGRSFLPVAYAFLVLVGLRLAEDQTPRRAAAIGVGTGYLLACAVLTQYPPFLLGAFIPAAFYQVGRFVARLRTGNRSAVLSGSVLPGGIAAVLAGIVFLALTIDKGDLIEAVRDSEHPGRRAFSSGYASIGFAQHLLSSNLSWFLRDNQTAAAYFINQSEASNVMVILPYLAIAGLVALVVNRNLGKPLDYALVTLLALTLLSGMWLLVEDLDGAFSLLQFSRIPRARFGLLLGMTQFLMLFRVTRALADARRDVAMALAGTVAVVTGSTLLWANLGIADIAPGFVTSRIVWAFLTSLMIAGVAALALARERIGLACLAGLSLLSVYDVNPLYRGLEPLTSSPLIEEIQRLSAMEPERSWVVVGGITFENMAVAAGARSVSGSTPYTQEQWWEQLSPSAEVDRIVDRSAHFTVALSDDTRVELRSTNHVELLLDPCGSFAGDIDLGFVVTTSPVDRACLVQQSAVNFERLTFFVYRRS